MLKRILRSSIMLAALVAAYQAYVLLAVPMMEPAIAIRQSQPISAEEREIGAKGVTKYQLLLSNYFPKDHWSQTQPPKVFASSNEQAMLVLDDYMRHEESRVNNERFTQVDIARFALLIFPTPPREGITPPRDTIILEAPQGAQLKFDEFRPELGRIGQVMGGKFPGQITIRSDMREPGPEDDLLVETADLEMNTKLMYSMSPVRFRMGPNVGGGRELEIRFLVDEHMQPQNAGLKIAGIDSLEIRRDVRMRLQLETDSLLPGGSSDTPSTRSVTEVRSHAERGNEEKKPQKPKPPIEATCSGPFTFDFVRYVASMDRDVDLRQINPNGPSDQLVCSQLDIHFAAKPLPPDQPQPVVVDPGKRQQRDLGRLEPVAIVAQGHPVLVSSPQNNAQARGERIQIVLRDQRVRIAAASDAMLVYGPNVLRAPVIDYQHPDREAATPIGRFRATGPGSLDYVADPEKPDQVFHAGWQTTVDLSREKGQPVLTLEGRPQLAFANMGSLSADRLKVYLRELAGDGPAVVGLPISASSGGGSKRQLVPDRLIATGRVDIQSPQLSGRTNQLSVAFKLQPGAISEESASGLEGRLAGSTNTEQRFHIAADKMDLELRVEGQSAVPTTLTCDGDVRLQEVPLAVTDEQPLEIRGGHVTVDRLDSDPYITLRGADPAGAAAGQKVQLAGRGISVLADVVEYDGRDNRMWSEGPGKATLLVTRNLVGQAAIAPFPLEITWQGGLEFDGVRTITFVRDVVVAGADDLLRCDRLSAKLSAPLVLGQGLDQNTIDLSEIECDGNVMLNHLSRDKVGVTSHERVQLARLTINQQTGAIAGVGPGVIRSTRFGNALDVLAGPNPAASAAAPSPGVAGSKLNFLRLEFQEGLAGNYVTREINFLRHVRAVYGPVDAWEQELDLARPETLPPEAMTLSCDRVRINEDPVAARAAAGNGESRPIGPVQLRAEGNVIIEGQTPRQGEFSARASSASYEQAKDAFILEGDGRNMATLWRAGQQGPPPEAGWIRYVRSTNEISVDKIQYLEITPADIENARRPKPVR